MTGTAARRQDGFSDAERAQDPTHSAAFKEWFGDSKLVNADGTPLVLYHGTRADVTTFGNIGGRFEISAGYYFTTSPSRASVYADSIANAAVNWNPASSFAKAVEEGANVMPVYLSIKNPLVVTDKDGPFNSPEDAFDAKGGALVQAAKDLGHDGVIFRREKGDGYDEVAAVAFHPEQIKSAISNNSRWDRGNMDIRHSYSSGGQPARQQSTGELAGSRELMELSQYRRMQMIKNTSFESPINPAEVDAERRIEKRGEVALDPMDERAARERARLDAEDFGKIQDQDLARFAAYTVTRNLGSPAYKAEFARAGADLLARVAERNAQNSALVAAKEERKARDYASMIAEREDHAKGWTPEQAAQQAQRDVVELQSLDQQGMVDSALRYERGNRLDDMAMFSKVNTAYREALGQIAPGVAAEVGGLAVSAEQPVNGTFIGKVMSLTDNRLEQKIGRDPRDVMVHDRRVLSGDDVAVGHVVSISYQMGKARLSNHDLAVEQRGQGR